jgi:hypothetical protein
MKRFLGGAFLVAMTVAATPCWAGLLDGVQTLTGGGGGSFAGTASLMQAELLVGMRSLVTAVGEMNEATGHKAQADQLRAISAELKNATEAKSDLIERTIKAVDASPVDRSQLMAAHDTKSKHLLVQSAGNMLVTGVFNAMAVNSARQLTALRPGLADAVQAPSLLNTAKVVVTAVPAEISHAATYTSMLADYMRDNKLTAPNMADQRQIAQAQGATPAAAAAGLN